MEQLLQQISAFVNMFHSLLDLPRDTCKYVISGTTPFRLSSKKMLPNKRQDTPNRNFGGNRQNIEKGMRVVWQADKGYKLVQVDQSGADALIVAHLCRKGKYRSLFENNVKPHTYIALKLFKNEWQKHFSTSEINEAIKAPIEELVKLKFWPELNKLIKSSDDWEHGKRYYFLGKKIVHGGSYGMFENTLILAVFKDTNGLVRISKEEAKNFLFGSTGFHSEFPEIKEWHQRVYIEAKKTRQLRNLFGFPYNITDYINKDDYKDLIAWVPASTVACITRNAFIKTHEYITNKDRDWHLLHDTHDSYLVEAREGEELECAKHMQEQLGVDLVSPVDGTKFKMKSEASVGWNWSPYKKDSNPLGMKAI